MNWKALSIAVAAIVVVGLILFGSPILRNLLLVNAGLDGQERYVNTVTGLFVAISVSIVLVAALGQLVNITWNGWQLGGVFGGMVFMIMAVSLLNPHITAPFVEDEDMGPPLLLTHVTFPCNSDPDQPFVYKIDDKYQLKNVFEPQGDEEKIKKRVESVVVAIYKLEQGAKGRIKQILSQLTESDFKNLTLLEPQHEHFKILKTALRKHIGTATHDDWIAYEVKLHDELSMRAVDTRLPIPLQADGNYPTVFLMKLKPITPPGPDGVTTSAAAAGEISFERFAHIFLDSMNPTSVGKLKLGGLLDMKLLIGATEHQC